MFEKAQELVSSTIIHFVSDSQSHVMERPESAPRASPSNNETGRSQSRSSVLQLRCCVESRVSQALSLFFKAGLLRGPGTQRPLSLERLSVRLEIAMADPRHECEGRRNCPLTFRLDETLVALRQLPLQPDKCLGVRVPGASDW